MAAATRKARPANVYSRVEGQLATYLWLTDTFSGPEIITFSSTWPLRPIACCDYGDYMRWRFAEPEFVTRRKLPEDNDTGESCGRRTEISCEWNDHSLYTTDGK